MSCIEGTKTIIFQIIGLLKKIDDQVYDQPIPLLGEATVGQHFRHVLNFYQCLIKGIDHGIVDYERRDRNPDIEKRTETASQTFLEIFDYLDWLEEMQSLKVRTGFSPQNNVEQVLVTSSVGRELMYAFDHALHHLAIIKIGLQLVVPHLELEETLGVAPSTLKYRSKKRD